MIKRLILAAALAAALTGCAVDPPPAVTMWPAPPAGLKVADVDTTTADLPALISVVQWLAFYGWDAFPVADKMTWAASYPVTGSTVTWFMWESTRLTPGGGITAEEAAAAGPLRKYRFTSHHCNGGYFPSVWWPSIVREDKALGRNTGTPAIH